MSPTRQIAICGKGELACRTLHLLYDLRAAGLHDALLLAVPTSADGGSDTWEPSLRKRASNLAVAVRDSVADAELAEDSLLLSLQFDRIIRLQALGGARAFNLHFSPLPRYRGCYPSVLPLRHGESESGVSLHVLTAGIDDGPLVGQIRFPLPPFLSAFELYRLYHRYGYELLKAHLPDLIDGRERATPQDESAATYFNRRSVDFSATALSDFNRPAQEVVNYLRSLIFPPHQLPTLDGRPIDACETVAWPHSVERLRAQPAIRRCGEETALLRCADGLIRLHFSAHDHDDQGDKRNAQ